MAVGLLGIASRFMLPTDDMSRSRSAVAALVVAMLALAAPVLAADPTSGSEANQAAGRRYHLAVTGMT
jgi:hypothetical protein